MLAKVEMNKVLVELGYTQPILCNKDNQIWNKDNITVFYQCKSLLTPYGACYAIRMKDDLLEAFSPEELRVKCFEMERRCYDI